MSDKVAPAVRAAVNRERVRNMKTICLGCRNGDPVRYVKEPESNIGSWRHGAELCAAGPIRDRAAKYGTERILK